MKNTILNTLAVFALLSAMFFTSCKKEDTTKPVITLSGDNPMTVNLGGTYTEPGASATDDVDGDISSKIVITGSVNTSVAGANTLTYTVTDAAGNSASLTRTVNVVHSRSNYLGNYTTTNNCPTPYSFMSTQTTMSAGATENKVMISLFYYNGGSLTITVNGANATVDAGQAPNPQGDPVTGSGTMNAAGTVLTMNYTFSPVGAPQENCTVVYTKQ